MSDYAVRVRNVEKRDERYIKFNVECLPGEDESWVVVRIPYYATKKQREAIFAGAPNHLICDDIICATRSWGEAEYIESLYNQAHQNSIKGKAWNDVTDETKLECKHICTTMSLRWFIDQLDNKA